MSVLLEWLPWIVIALVPGLFNILVAFRQLDDDCKFLPFFEPWKSLGVWWWSLVQLALPAIAFWLIFNLTAKPRITFELVTLAIAFGLGFISIFNSYVETGFFNFDIKAIYSGFVGFAYDLIAAGQTRKAAAFWTAFENELNQSGTNVNQGLDYLENYFVIDPSLTLQEKKDAQEKLDQVRVKSTRSEQAEAIRSLLTVRRNDLPEVLWQFGCGETLQKFFPRQHKELMGQKPSS